MEWDGLGDGGGKNCILLFIYLFFIIFSTFFDYYIGIVYFLTIIWWWCDAFIIITFQKFYNIIRHFQCTRIARNTHKHRLIEHICHPQVKISNGWMAYACHFNRIKSYPIHWPSTVMGLKRFSLYLYVCVCFIFEKCQYRCDMWTISFRIIEYCYLDRMNSVSNRLQFIFQFI